jgi:WXXGXW repeat (2 copies)
MYLAKKDDRAEGSTMRNVVAIRSMLFSLVLLAFSHASFGQIGISVSFGPPPIPVYEQPICPEDGYIWTPGYWDYSDDDGYFWVPGTWVEAPQPGYLWTPGYWGWGNNAYFFHEGYWGEHVGFYGGIDYGYGYGGRGYEGGRWDNGHFFYNRSVNHVNETIIHNTYNTTVIENHNTRISYNGGHGGVKARATSQEETYGRERHVGRVSAQDEHIQQARSNPELRASRNQGKPPIAATAKPGDFRSGAVAARQAGGAYKAPPVNASRHVNETHPGNEARPTTENRPGNQPVNNSAARAVNNGHARDLQPHTFTPPNAGNAATDKRYQDQQNKLATKQSQEHQKLQQQQEKEHQQAEKRSINDAQKQQMEQRHTQQTQHVEQKHAVQQQHLEQHQQPRPNTSRPAENHPPAERPH